MSSCSGLAELSVVVAVRVTSEADRMSPEESERLTTVQVEEVLKGIDSKTKELKVESMIGTSCGVHLEAGKRYVLFGSVERKSERLVLQTGGCRPLLRLPEQNLQYSALRRIAGGGHPLLIGSVAKRTGAEVDFMELSGVRIRARKGNQVLEAVSNSQGEYEIDGVEPGTYQVEASLPGYIPDETWNRSTESRSWMLQKPDLSKPTEVEIQAGKCTARPLYFWPNGRLSGTVIGGDGKPVAGEAVQALPEEIPGKSQSLEVKTAVTDKNGRFEISGLPSGAYTVGINARRYSDASAYPKTLYQDGKRIQVGEGQLVSGIDITAPKPRREIRIEVRWREETPVNSVRSFGPSIRLLGLDGEQRSSTSLRDGQDAAQIVAYAGEPYVIVVSKHYSDNQGLIELKGSAQIGPLQENTRLEIVLRPKD